MQELSVDNSVCIVNIGKAGRQRRMWFGVIGIATGAVLAVVLAATGGSMAVRLLPFAFFASGASGLWQARDKT